MNLSDVSPLQRSAPEPLAPNRYGLAGGWEAEVAQASDIETVDIAAPSAANALLAVTKRPSSGVYRLTHRLDFKHAADLEDIVLCYTCRTEGRGILEAGGVLERRAAAEPRIVAPARHRIVAEADGAVTFTGVAHLDPKNLGSRELFLFFELSPSAGRLEVMDFYVEGFAADWLDTLPDRAAAGERQKASGPLPVTRAETHAAGAAEPASPSTGDAADPAAYAFMLKQKILAAAEAAAFEHRTPYYALLAEALQITHDLAILTEAERTLTRIDGDRIGSRPPLEGPLVSIVMPVHDRAALALQAIASVRAQTHRNFELLVCDDGSGDATPAALAAIGDERLRVFRHEERRGAAAARNTCLREARGAYVAYLDSDNLWHPRYLELMLEAFARWPGSAAVYAGYFDVQTDSAGKSFLRDAIVRPFQLEDQLEAPFVDLNSFMHRCELFDVLGGFDERLVRRQDYDLILRYGWTRPLRHVPYALTLYRRIVGLGQITDTQGQDRSAPALIQEKVGNFYKTGVPARMPDWLGKATVLSWDMSRNHFAKAFCVAEALSRHIEVQLISFRFFEEPIFRPLAQAKPPFELLSFAGGEFPAFFDTFSRAVDAIDGDVIYAVKPRLTSLGAALIANHRTGKPIFLEANDLETVVASPTRGDRHAALPLTALLERAEDARVPHADIWSQLLDACAQEIPTIFTHNVNLDVHYGRRSFQMRNIKDETVYDPAAYDRDAVRAELGFGPGDRVILFGGLVRRHKGVFELVDLVEHLGRNYKLLVVGSRETPDLRELAKRAAGQVAILPPQPPERMAALNLAADLVILWLDPSVPASHFQSPYKLTDALAMGSAIIASPVGGLAEFAGHDVMWMVPFGEFDRLIATIGQIFADDSERLRRRERARKLFLREFSYNSVPAAIATAASMLAQPTGIYPVATRFAEAMAAFEARLR